MYDSDATSTRSERLDAVTVLFYGICVAVIACILVGLRAVDTFIGTAFRRGIRLQRETEGLV